MTSQSFLKRFAVTFCLLFFLQQVHPLSVNNFHRSESVNDADEDSTNRFGNQSEQSFGNEDKIDDEVDYDEIDYDEIETGLVNQPRPRKRRIVNVILLGISLTFMTGGIAWDVYLESTGCCNDWNLCKYREEYEDLYKYVNEEGKQIDILYNAAYNTQIFTTSLNALIAEAWLRILAFDENMDRVLNALDSSALEKMSNLTLELQIRYGEANQSLAEFSDIELEYVGVFSEVGFGLLRVSGIVLTGIYGVVKYVSYKKAQRAVSSGIATRPRSNAITQGPQGFWANIKNNYNNFGLVKWYRGLSKTKQKALKYAANGFMTAIFAGLEIWNIVRGIEQCEEKTKEAKTARDSLLEEKPIIDALKVNATIIDINATENYYYIVDQLRTENITDFVRVALETALAADNQSAEIVNARKLLTEFLDEVNTTTDRAKLEDVVYKLIYGLANSTYRYQCYAKKIEALKTAQESCSIGSYTLEVLFIRLQQQEAITAESCVDNGYIQKDVFLNYIRDAMVLTNKSQNCLLNNENKINSICLAYILNEEADTTAQKQELTVEEVEEVFKSCPKGTVNDNTKNAICNERYQGKTLNETQAIYFKYEETEVVQAYNTCPQIDITDLIKPLICTFRKDGYSIEEIKAKLEIYKPDQIEFQYEECGKVEVEWKVEDIKSLCDLAGVIDIDSTTGPVVYAPYINDYGEDEVRKKIEECGKVEVEWKEEDIKSLCDLAGLIDIDSTTGPLVYLPYINDYGEDEVRKKIEECQKKKDVREIILKNLEKYMKFHDLEKKK